MNHGLHGIHRDLDPRVQLEQLQQQHQALLQQHEVLRARHRAQQDSTEEWLRQRTRELQADAAEQKKAEALQRVFYRIAERAAAGLSFYEFLQTGHQLLGELMYARNCYICLYNAERRTLNFPYYVDERDGDTMQTDDVPLRRGLTEYVLRTERPQLIDAQRFIRLQASGEVTEATGDLSFTTWLGVPMQMRGAIGGALVIQSYEAGIHYTESDADVLAFVANHFSSAIERYQAIDALHKSEARYRTVIENAGVGVVVVQNERMVFGNPRLASIVGHPLQVLLSQPFDATLHPDDRPAMIERHRRRLRGEPVEPHFSFRIVTQAGEVRWLDLSAVKIEWSQADATLLFVVDATARVEAEQAQRITLRKQVELNDTKSRFIAMTSHEFRTPLAIIHGSVELLRHYEDRLPPEKKRLAWQQIEDAVDRMTRMLEHVQAIGHAEAGPFECRPAAVDMAQFGRVLLDELRSVMGAPYERVAWAVQLPPPGQHYWLDEALIRKIVGNLLSNAVKYSPDGGSLVFAVAEAGEHLVITVADQGIGIPGQDQAGLFKSFYRASNVGTIVGTGLGLSIVKQAVDCHRGSIELASEAGKGSRFTVKLPLVKCPPAASAADLDAEKPRMKILIAEDEPSLRENLQLLLELEGHEVQLAVDGQEAYALARSAPPDLVLTDVMMPVLDGYGLIRLLRDDPATAAVPIIVLTARAEQQDAETGLRLGAVAHLVKPYRRAELLQAVEAQMKPAASLLGRTAGATTKQKQGRPETIA